VRVVASSFQRPHWRRARRSASLRSSSSASSLSGQKRSPLLGDSGSSPWWEEGLNRGPGLELISRGHIFSLEGHRVAARCLRFFVHLLHVTRLNRCTPFTVIGIRVGSTANRPCAPGRPRVMEGAYQTRRRGCRAYRGWRRPDLPGAVDWTPGHLGRSWRPLG
jgi:hypothetical protein